MYYVAITGIAPEGEVGKREYNHMIRIIHVEIQHVVFDIAAAVNLWCSRFKAEPVLTTIITHTTLIINMDAFKAFFWGDVLGCAVRTIPFRFNCVESLNLHILLLFCFLVKLYF